ncbi:MAG: hypothetical protein IPK97_20830 [Ahniella sp.]|nr:hypothetical protein [Ahniella sp.]
MLARIETGLTGHRQLVLSGIPAAAMGHKGQVRLMRHVNVHDSRGVHESTDLLNLPVTVLTTELRLDWPDQPEHWYSYQGKDITLKLLARLEIDDGIIFDSSYEAEILQPAPEREDAHAKPASELIEPRDSFSFMANLSAIPPKNKVIVLALMIVGGFIALINAAIGVHDEFVPESATFFYDHRGSDGSESPIMKSMFGSGGLGLTVWLIVRSQLRRYMSIRMREAEWTPYRGLVVSVRDVMEGRARVPLEKVTIRVVAVNIEKGQYKRGSGTKERTVSFSTPSRGVLLFEQFLPFVPAHAPIEGYLDGHIDFTPMFDVLYPPVQTSPSHGIGLDWEVQLLHPLFVDQELKGKVAGIDWREFYRRE